MLNSLKPTILEAVKRHYHKVAAFAAFVAFIALLISLKWAVITSWFDPVVSIAPGPDLTVEGDVYSLKRALPTKLRIPEINVDTTFEAPLELNPDQTIEVPESYDKVGWYKLGAAPGEIGTATILGHVDSFEGAEVFYHLGGLEPGDRIYVDRDDGTTATFVVEKLERYSQDDFPGEEVYGMTDYPSLRLITCSGSFDRAEQRYSHNLVVFAHLVEPDKEEDAN